MQNFYGQRETWFELEATFYGSRMVFPVNTACDRVNKRRSWNINQFSLLPSDITRNTEYFGAFENTELCCAQIRCAICYVYNNSNTGEGIFMKFDPGLLNSIDNTQILVKTKLFTWKLLTFLFESEANSPDVYQQKNIPPQKKKEILNKSEKYFT